MGYGNYSHDAHQIISQQRSKLPTQQVFKQTDCHALMNPKGVKVRESRDSVEHPTSLGVVFALDVTGSMGTIPAMLAKKELPRFMKILTDCKVDSPQLLFMAVGDATSDRAPLQVGQFESTAELMDRWLTWSFLEGNGGGQNHESYELALYFLAEHTDMDCWVKRQKPGYMFMTGDELPYPVVSKHQVESLIGDHVDDDIPVAAVVAALEETMRPFFLIPDSGRRDQCERPWRDLLGDHVIAMENAEDTCFVAASIVGLTERVVPDLDEVAKLVAGAGATPDQVGRVVRALTPYAATLDAAGVPHPRTRAGAVKQKNEGKSLWHRIKRAIT